VLARGLNARPTGRGLLARELIPALRRVRSDINVHLFAASDPCWPGVAFHPENRGPIANLWRQTIGIANEMKRINPDVVWSVTHLLPGGLPRRIPRVATLLDLVWRDHPTTMDRGHRLAAKYGERRLHQADRIVCISAFTRERLAQYFPQLLARSCVIRLAPRSLADSGKAQQLSVSGPMVANVGTIEPRKNLGLLLEAMERLPAVTLVQCGDIGWNASEIVAKAKSMPNVRLLGYADDETVSRVYRSATVAAFPTLYEGFDLPPLEAMAAGCPVIASDIPVHHEVLGDAAQYVKAGDPSALAAAIDAIVHAPNLQQQLRTRGLEQAAKYSWDTAAIELSTVFDELAGR
jgi:glycosyltransferase involved in cell wall biosynthesis